MPLSGLQDQIEEIHFCLHCAEELFKQWRGWPVRDSIPVPPIIDGGTCPKCGGAEVVVSFDIAWLNIHGPYSTGLPDYWVLNISLSGGSKRFPSKWGLPYFKQGTCPRCGANTIISLFAPPIGWQLKQQCTKCSFVSQEDRK